MENPPISCINNDQIHTRKTWFIVLYFSQIKKTQLYELPDVMAVNLFLLCGSTQNGPAARTPRWAWWRPSCLWTSWWTSRTRTSTSPTPSTPSRLPRASARCTPTKAGSTDRWRCGCTPKPRLLKPFDRLNADWFQLVGLIHDVGKIMALWDEPQVRVWRHSKRKTQVTVSKVKCVWLDLWFLHWLMLIIIKPKDRTPSA